jgi:hypothetical protein
MKPLFLAALALPILLTGCGTYVGYDDGYGPGYYDGVYGDVAVYGYDRGGYQPHYHHYDGSYHNSNAVASHSFAHESHVASAGHVSGGHVGGGGGGSAAHASASVSGGHR